MGQELTFRIKRFVAQGLFEKASAVVPSKDLMPVLKNFLVEVSPGSVRVVATDMELSVVCSTGLVEATGEGRMVIPAKKMLDIVREAPDGDILFTLADELTIQAGGASWTLRLPPGDDYPGIPDSSQVTWTTVSLEELLTGIQSVRYAAAQDMTRPSLMMLNVKDKKMTACDGVRFQQTDVTFDIDVQIPIGAVNDLVRLLKAYTDVVKEIEVGETEFHLVFKVGSDVFIAAKLMASFPDVESLLLRPALMNKDALGLARADLVTAVRRVRINADPESSAIVLELSENACRVVSRDKWGNQASETLPASWQSGTRSVAVNAQYLLDMLGMSKSTSCQFFLGEDSKSKKSPLMLKDEGTVGIVNQMRVDWVN